MTEHEVIKIVKEKVDEFFLNSEVFVHKRKSTSPMQREVTVAAIVGVDIQKANKMLDSFFSTYLDQKVRFKESERQLVIDKEMEVEIFLFEADIKVYKQVNNT